jgi:uncharacterized protein
MDRDDILAFLEANKLLIQRDFGVERIGLFGSYARRMEGADSDVDIVVEFDTTHKTLRNYFGFKRYLESHFGREVDLGIEGAMKPLVRESVRKQAIYV